jgi:hypothetical protein
MFSYITIHIRNNNRLQNSAKISELFHVANNVITMWSVTFNFFWKNSSTSESNMNIEFSLSLWKYFIDLLDGLETKYRGWLNFHLLYKTSTKVLLNNARWEWYFVCYRSNMKYWTNTYIHTCKFPLVLSTNLFQQVNTRQCWWLFIDRTKNILHFFCSNSNIPNVKKINIIQAS